MPARPLVLVRSQTSFGRELQRICARRRLPLLLVGTEQVTDDLGEQMRQHEAWGVIDGVGDEEWSMIGFDRSRLLRERCEELDLPLLTYATRLVEEDVDHQGQLLVRGFDLFGGRYHEGTIDRLLHGMAFETDPEELLVPTYLPDLIDAALDLFIDGERGTWRLTHGLAVTPDDLLRVAHQLANAPPGTRCPAFMPGIGLHGPRLHPLLPPLADALQRWMVEQGPNSVLLPDRIVRRTMTDSCTALDGGQPFRKAGAL